VYDASKSADACTAAEKKSPAELGRGELWADIPRGGSEGTLTGTILLSRGL
jgi:hypothetical protein